MPSPAASSVLAQPGIPEAIFFDVDGVLIESLSVKGEAFALVFSDFPDDRDSIIDYHLAHGGVNRVEKIRQIFVQLTGRMPTDSELAERVHAFSELVVEQVITAPEIAGAGMALEFWSARVPLHAVSATPLDELLVIFDRRGMSQYFASIHGWPPKKTELLPELVRDLGYATGACVMVGDSAEDEAAARAAGTLFIRVSPHEQDRSTEGVPVIRDLHGLTDAISTLRGRTSQ
jgi:phosphoglycolate phosphatase-like HAD superfamily hydrolase